MCPSDDWEIENQLFIWINIRETVVSSRGIDFREILLWAFKQSRLLDTKLSARKRRKQAFQWPDLFQLTVRS